MSKAPHVVVKCATYVFSTLIVIGGAALKVGFVEVFGTVSTQPAGYGTFVDVVVGAATTFLLLPPPTQVMIRNAATTIAPTIAALRIERLRLRFLISASRASRARRAFSFLRWRLSAVGTTA